MIISVTGCSTCVGVVVASGFVVGGGALFPFPDRLCCSSVSVGFRFTTLHFISLPEPARNLGPSIPLRNLFIHYPNLEAGIELEEEEGGIVPVARLGEEVFDRARVHVAHLLRVGFGSVDVVWC